MSGWHMIHVTWFMLHDKSWHRNHYMRTIRYQHGVTRIQASVHFSMWSRMISKVALRHNLFWHFLFMSFLILNKKISILDPQLFLYRGDIVVWQCLYVYEYFGPVSSWLWTLRVPLILPFGRSRPSGEGDHGRRSWKAIAHQLSPFKTTLSVSPHLTNHQTENHKNNTENKPRET